MSSRRWTVPVLSVLFMLVGVRRVLQAPYTKVEESFNLQAIHDILHYGIGRRGLLHYDHVVFTGPIPRTFIGALVLSLITKAIIYLTQVSNLYSNKFNEQIIVRIVLLLINTYSLGYFFNSCKKLWGVQITSTAFLLTILQFHIPFYASRTIPNFFAFPIVTIALGSYVKSLSSTSNSFAIQSGIWLVTTSIIFRLEVLALLAPLAITSLISRKVRWGQVVKWGLISTFISLPLTGLIDSYFWNKWTIPEVESLFFNVVNGKMEDWGVMPFHYFFTNSLPKLLGLSFPLAVTGIFLDVKMLQIGLPCLAYVCIMSFVKHKEWRFIVYVVPVFNLCSAACYHYIAQRLAMPRWIRQLGIVGLMASALLYSEVSSAAAHLNYPGGTALYNLHKIVPKNGQNLNLHLDNLVTQTGASRFLQLYDDTFNSKFTWLYDKSENITTPEQISQFDVILTESFTSIHKSLGFKVIDTTASFENIYFQLNPRFNLNAVKNFNVKTLIQDVWPIKIKVKENTILTLQRS